MEELDEICNEDSFELYLSAMAEKTEYLTDTDWDEIFQQGFLKSLQWDGDDFGNDTNERNKLVQTAFGFLHLFEALIDLLCRS